MQVTTLATPRHGIAGPPAVKETSEIEGVLNKLALSQDVSNNVINKLIEKLTPVLPPYSEADVRATQPPRAQMSPLGNRLQDLCDKQEEINLRLNQIIQHVVL